MEKILEMLSSGEAKTGEWMSAQLGMTRTAVWKKIEALREDGWDIRSMGKRGYVLEAGDRLDPVLWQGKLKTRRYGRAQVLFEETLESTNQSVKKMALSGAEDGSLALCEQQTAGKGRLGRTWVSEPGVGLWQSLLLRPGLPPDQAPALTFAAALAMARALENLGVDGVRIKWPNDLVRDGKKIAGILNEVSCDMDTMEYVVIGIGLNVRKGAVPPSLASSAGCLEDGGVPPLRRDILCGYLLEMEQQVSLLSRKGMGALMEMYREKSCTLGNPVRVVGTSFTFTGEALDMDPDGALLVKDETGTVRRVLAGDVSVRGVMGYV